MTSRKSKLKRLPSHSPSTIWCITSKMMRESNLMSRTAICPWAVLGLTTRSTAEKLRWSEPPRQFKTTILSIILCLAFSYSSLDSSHLLPWHGWTCHTRPCSCFKPFWSGSASTILWLPCRSQLIGYCSFWRSLRLWHSIVFTSRAYHRNSVPRRNTSSKCEVSCSTGPHSSSLEWRSASLSYSAVLSHTWTT